MIPKQAPTRPKEKKMLKKSQVWSMASTAVMALALGACTNSRAAADEARPGASSDAARPSATKKRAPSAAGVEGLSAEGRKSIARALAAYEQVRAQLASDAVADVKASAGGLEKAASAAAGKVPNHLRAHLKNVALSSRKLKEMPKNDADAVRLAFGDVSRSVVALIAAEPSLRQGRHVFKCPMAQGYKQWVQKAAKLSNPYMGTRMPTCGKQGEWKVTE